MSGPVGLNRAGAIDNAAGWAMFRVPEGTAVAVTRLRRRKRSAAWSGKLRCNGTRRRVGDEQFPSRKTRSAVTKPPHPSACNPPKCSIIHFAEMIAPIAGYAFAKERVAILVAARAAAAQFFEGSLPLNVGQHGLRSLDTQECKKPGKHALRVGCDI